MMISGEFKRLPRTPMPAPDDGVHRHDARGRISGAKAHTLNGEIVPHGMTCFLYKNTKVFYGLKSELTYSESTVRNILNFQKKLHRHGICLPAHDMVNVMINAKYGDDRIIINAHGYNTDVVPITPRLIEYFKGKPYKWEGNDCPESFTKFADHVAKTITEVLPGSVLSKDRFLKDLRRIGNILWHEDHKRYYLVDCG